MREHSLKADLNLKEEQKQENSGGNQDKSNKAKTDKIFMEVTGIQNDSSQFSQICQMRNWLPDPIGGVIWWAPGPPKTAVHVPFYCGITQLSEQYTEGDHFSFEWRNNAGWASVVINTFSNVLYSYIIEDIKLFQNKIEGQSFSNVKAIDQQALELYKSNPDKARQLLTDWCINSSNRITAFHWEFAEFLIWKYHNSFIWQPEKAMRPEMENQDWWYEKTLEYREEIEGWTIKQPE